MDKDGKPPKNPIIVFWRSRVGIALGCLGVLLVVALLFGNSYPGFFVAILLSIGMFLLLSKWTGIGFFLLLLLKLTIESWKAKALSFSCEKRSTAAFWIFGSLVAIGLLCLPQKTFSLFGPSFLMWVSAERTAPSWVPPEAHHVHAYAESFVMASDAHVFFQAPYPVCVATAERLFLEETEGNASFFREHPQLAKSGETTSSHRQEIDSAAGHPAPIPQGGDSLRWGFNPATITHGLYFSTGGPLYRQFWIDRDRGLFYWYDSGD